MRVSFAYDFPNPNHILPLATDFFKNQPQKGP